MWAKLVQLVIKQILLELPGLVIKGFSAVREYLDRRKARKTAIEAGERVQNASDASTIRNSADDLP